MIDSMSGSSSSAPERLVERVVFFASAACLRACFAAFFSSAGFGAFLESGGIVCNVRDITRKESFIDLFLPPLQKRNEKFSNLGCSVLPRL